MPLNIPAVPVKYFLIAHFVLTTWATLDPWLQECYLYTNYLVLAIGLWALRDKTSKEPLQFLILAHLFTVLNDIILLGMYFSVRSNMSSLISGGSDRFRFTAAMAILNLLLKPVSCLFMYKDWQDRTGAAPYEDLAAEGARPVAKPESAPPYSVPGEPGYMPPTGNPNNPYQTSQNY